jgi:hypothetical protein
LAPYWSASGFEQGARNALGGLYSRALQRTFCILGKRRLAFTFDRVVNLCVRNAREDESERRAE